ncbi:hypothetical protein PPERSA_00952 [Pseudocohnilembus persalinus]|uniref:Transmembrane protein n=1 Tax=Pseudocohnilembus persalinus TaxID=266149 RepID=A0A0V0R8H9_PSEPJ|nr:hypothetical protein PPERSA_00952 [Pseudocohnilembus persalinus]|eukprot:KRX10782.1 hypothetical protein PPERSA_00952 [Pseudocohnilembus persalinus]
MILFFATSFLAFVFTNTPKASTYTIPLTDDTYPVNDFVVGFFWGKDTLDPFDLSSGQYFTIKLIQQVRQIGKDPVKSDLPVATGENCQKSWLNNNDGETIIDIKYIYCVDTEALEKQNQQYIDDGEYDKVIDYVIKGNSQFDEYSYPQIQVEYCNPENSQVTCKSEEELEQITSGGRIMLYLHKPQQKDYVTNKLIDSVGSFHLYYYFLVPGDYIRYAINYQIQDIVQSPDYFLRFSPVTTTTFKIINQIFYPSQNVYNKYLGLSVWTSLTSEILKINYIYDTSIVVLSLTAAFFNVIFSLFALFFLGYNKNSFYKKKKNWDNFEQQIERIKQIEGNNPDQNDSRLEDLKQSTYSINSEAQAFV